MSENYFYYSVEKKPMQAAYMISKQISEMENIIGLHYGSPIFSPPSFLLDKESNIFSNDNVTYSMKSYEEPRGKLALRKAIADWYYKRLKLTIDPETEILITNGSSEALTLAILATTNPRDDLLILNPSYTSFGACAFSLDRKIKQVTLLNDLNAQLESILRNNSDSIRACIINSPCNPTGNILTTSEWESLSRFCEKKNAYLVHDEILDVFTFDENDYISAASIASLRNKAVLINSMSKTFGLPGLRIGWIIANKKTISEIIELKSSLCLGVNLLSEVIAERVLSNVSTIDWIRTSKSEIIKRVDYACAKLNTRNGFSWQFKPKAGFCLFPNVSSLYSRLPKKYHLGDLSKGASVAQYFLDEKGVAVTPGSIYGSEGRDHIKIVVCGKEKEFYTAINRICSNNAEIKV
jgi:aspartate/methionine/tyrosine aminotransferase